MTRASYSGPAHPIGYVEVQYSWVGEKTHDEVREIIDEAIRGVQRDNPALVGHGSRIEFTLDGAGVRHHTLYMGFAPAQPSSEPLDPRNMNDAPRPTAGMPEATDGIMPLGTKENKF